MDPTGSIKDLTAPIKLSCDLASKLLGPAAEEFGLYLRDRLRVWRTRNIHSVLQLTDEKLRGQGAEPVEPKFLFQVMEKASLEADEYLQEKWASLLASAALGKKPLQSFANILSELSPKEAGLLDRLFAADSKTEYYFYHSDGTDELGWKPPPGGSPRSDCHILNLVRLGLVRFEGSIPWNDKRFNRQEGIALTNLGLAFVECCHQE